MWVLSVDTDYECGKREAGEMSDAGSRKTDGREQYEAGTLFVEGVGGTRVLQRIRTDEARRYMLA